MDSIASLYLHNLGAAHIVGYTGHPLSRSWKLTPPTQWLAGAMGMQIADYERCGGARDYMMGQIIATIGAKMIDQMIEMLQTWEPWDVKGIE